jgi:serine protease AprX
MMLNGTSMATPVVSGAVADILQGQSSLTPDQVKARLMKTAYKQFPLSSTAVDPVTGQTFTSQYDIMTIGAGYLDLASALANHDVATGTALSPTARFDASSGNVYLVYDPSSTWDDSDATSGSSVGGTKAVWGTQAVWGTDTVAADKAVWGTQAVWGTSSVEGFKAVWGTDTDSADKAVWGTQAIWGTKAVWGAKAVWGTDTSTGDSDTSVTATQR